MFKRKEKLEKDISPISGGHLSATDKRRLATLIKENQKRIAAPQSAQDTLPYIQMFKDGICHVTKGYYTRTVEFLDINYQLSSDDDKMGIFQDWCDFINYFSPEVPAQYTFFNLKANEKESLAAVEIPEKPDEFNHLRTEYSDFLKEQHTKGKNGILRTKYTTFGVRADNYVMARSRLERIQNEVLNNFKGLGCPARALDGSERLESIHKIMKEHEPFNFHWDLISKTGLSTKDFIAPDGFDFSASSFFRMGKKVGACTFLEIQAPQLGDRMLADMLDMESVMLLNIHVRNVDQGRAIKLAKQKLSNLQKDKMEEHKKTAKLNIPVDDGYLPADLLTNINNMEEMRDKLQAQNEKMFLVTIIIVNIANNHKQLKLEMAALADIAQQYNCPLRPLSWQHEAGLMSSLPLGYNAVQVERALTTTSAAVFMPFTSQEIYDRKPTSQYYGLNGITSGMIIADRLSLKNPNGLILGTSGSGKSMAAKGEITDVFFKRPDDDIIILDPEREYSPLVESLNGQVIKISLNSNEHVNPMDIDLSSVEAGERPINIKIDFIMSFFEIIMSRPQEQGLKYNEKTIIDRCVPIVYEKYIRNPLPENMPLLGDLHEELKKASEPEAKELAIALELYVTGSHNLFNYHTNVDINNRLVCYDIKDLGKMLKPLGMLIVQDQIWTRATKNRNKKITWNYYDEFHVTLEKLQTALYFVGLWKRLRKWGCVLTGITQNVKDFLFSPQVENIFENSDFIMLLSQGPGDREILAEKLNISEKQLSFIEKAPQGEGLLVVDHKIIPFRNPFPTDTQLYKLMTTKPQELS